MNTRELVEGGAEKVLEPLEKRRKCERLLEKLRSRNKRSIGTALRQFIYGLVFAYIAWSSGVVAEITGEHALTPSGTGALVLALWIAYSGITMVLVHPRDKLLIVLAEWRLSDSETCTSTGKE